MNAPDRFDPESRTTWTPEPIILHADDLARHLRLALQSAIDRGEQPWELDVDSDDRGSFIARITPDPLRYRLPIAALAGASPQWDCRDDPQRIYLDLGVRGHRRVLRVCVESWTLVGSELEAALTDAEDVTPDEERAVDMRSEI